jgi:hypothetical protein
MIAKGSRTLKAMVGLAITLLVVVGLLFYLDVFNGLLGSPQSQAESVVKKFLTAMRAGPQASASPKEQTLQYFTTAARGYLQVSKAAQNSLPTIQGNWQVGSAVIEADVAKVPVKVQMPGQDPGTIKFMLRRESGKWLIFALETPLDSGASDNKETESIVMNFENPMQTISQMFGGAGAPPSPEEFGQRMIQGMQQSMQNAAKKAEDQAAELAAKLADFTAITPAEFEQQWRHAMEITDRESQEFLAELAEMTKLDIQIDDLPEDVRQRKITLQAQGSYLEILERVSNELGYYPTYRGQDEVKLEKLPRPSPVVFAGPVRLEVASLTEFTPHTSGLLRMDYQRLHLPAMESLGQGPSDVTMNIVDADGGSLVDTTSGSILMNNQPCILLKGLLSKVDKIKSCSGSITLTIPTKTEVFQADDLTAGAELTQGEVKVQLKSVEQVLGASAGNSTYSFVWSGVQPKGFVAVAFDKDGKAIRATQSRQSSMRAEISGANVASIKLTLVTETEQISYPFELLDIPLPNHQAQPAELAPLTFTGDAPVEITLGSIQPSRGGNFFRAFLKVNNRANKAVREVMMEYTYNTKDFPQPRKGIHSASWFSEEKTRQAGILIQAGESTMIEMMSAFISKDSKLQVQATMVKFADGTMWMATGKDGPGNPSRPFP